MNCYENRNIILEKYGFIYKELCEKGLFYVNFESCANGGLFLMIDALICR